MQLPVADVYEIASHLPAYVSLAATAAFVLLSPLYFSQRRDLARLHAWMEREPGHPATDVAASEGLLDRAETELEALFGAEQEAPSDAEAGGQAAAEPTVVVGAGTMGLMMLQLLLHAGAGPVAVVDRVRERLEVARKLGAAQAVTDASALGDARFTVAVDATGVPEAVETAIGLLDRGGRMLVFGVTPAEAAIRVSPFRVYNDEITITGSMAILRSFGQAVDLLASGAVDPRPLLSEPLPLEGYGDAVDRIRAGQGIKWHIRPL